MFKTGKFVNHLFRINNLTIHFILTILEIRFQKLAMQLNMEHFTI